MPELSEGQIFFVIVYLFVGASAGLHAFNEPWHLLSKIFGFLTLAFLWLPIAIGGTLLAIWYDEA